jgi:HTH-type transcriptional regulator / antitoxin HigA
MAGTKTQASRRDGLDGYLELIRRLPLRPIRSERELDRAIAVINELLDRDRLTPAEADYLDVLGDLVERYEETTEPIGDVSEADMLRFLIDQKGVTQAEVARATGVRERPISEVLSGKRQLSRAQLGKLAAYFHVSPAVFMPETDSGKTRRKAGKGR